MSNIILSLPEKSSFSPAPTSGHRPLTLVQQEELDRVDQTDHSTVLPPSVASSMRVEWLPLYPASLIPERYHVEAGAIAAAVGLSTSQISPHVPASEFFRGFKSLPAPPILDEETGELMPDFKMVLTRNWIRVPTLIWAKSADGSSVVVGATEIDVPVDYQRQSVEIPSRAIVCQGGSYVEVKLGRIKILDAGGPAAGGGKRGLAQFSEASRRRLMKTIAKTERDNRPLFVTLTYPDAFPQDQRKWKRDLDVFGKRFRRKFNAGAFIWRMEFVERRSGENVGKIAPHFHLLVWGVDYADLLAWVSQAWYRVADLGDERHLSAGTSVEVLRSWAGVMHYVSKYITKVITDEVGAVGRWWGVVARENIPWAAVRVIGLSLAQAVQSVRLGRRFLGLAGKTLRFGMSWVMIGDRFLDYLEGVLNVEIGEAF